MLIVPIMLFNPNVHWHICFIGLTIITRTVTIQVLTIAKNLVILASALIFFSAASLHSLQSRLFLYLCLLLTTAGYCKNLVILGSALIFFSAANAWVFE